MSKILAVGSPKGGVGKTTEAVTLAAVAAQVLKLRTLLVDADMNHSTVSWAKGSDDETMPFDVASGAGDPSELVELRRGRRYDLTIVDLPGAREGGLDTMLRGDAGRPAADLLLIPVQPEVMDLDPVVRVVRREVVPLGIPYLIVLTKVTTSSLPRAQQRQNELRADLGLSMAATIIRAYSVYNEAREQFRTVLDMPGKHSYARTAEAENRALAHEVFAALGFDTEPLRRPSKWLSV